MHFVTHLTIAMIALMTIVLACILFTNAIEFLGNKLKLGNNATGSILAVIGTGLPEVVVPLVAIFGANYSNIKIETAQDIALGAILGSPFMLSTLALFLLFLVLIFKKKKQAYLDYTFVVRDYKYFLISYVVAVLFSINYLIEYKYIASITLIVLYVLFVYRTILKSRVACVECECDELYFSRKIKLNNNLLLFLQLFISLIILIVSSHCFVNEITYFSNILNMSPAILALIITPFATELPECINSIIWLKQGKDELAFANVLGAVVFQSTLLFSIGIFLTPWMFEKAILINIILTIICAFFFVISVSKNKKIKLTTLLFCGIIYFFYLLFYFCK